MGKLSISGGLTKIVKAKDRRKARKKDVLLILIVKQRTRIGVLNCLISLRFFLLAQPNCLRQVPLFPLLRLLCLGGSLALLNSTTQFVVVPVLSGMSVLPTPRRPGLPTRMFVFILTPAIASAPANHSIPHVCTRSPFFAQARLVLQEICYVLSFLADVCTLVFPVFVDVLELLERLDDV